MTINLKDALSKFIDSEFTIVPNDGSKPFRMTIFINPSDKNEIIVDAEDKYEPRVIKIRINPKYHHSEYRELTLAVLLLANPGLVLEASLLTSLGYGLDIGSETNRKSHLLNFMNSVTASTDPPYLYIKNQKIENNQRFITGRGFWPYVIVERSRGKKQHPKKIMLDCSVEDVQAVTTKTKAHSLDRVEKVLEIRNAYNKKPPTPAKKRAVKKSPAKKPAAKRTTKKPKVGAEVPPVEISQAAKARERIQGAKPTPKSKGAAVKKGAVKKSSDKPSNSRKEPLTVQQRVAINKANRNRR